MKSIKSIKLFIVSRDVIEFTKIMSGDTDDFRAQNYNTKL